MADVVDERNQVVRQLPKDEVHKQGLIHRTSRVFILNSKGELFLAKKSAEKGGVWTGSSSGHFEVGEGGKACALRELSEELGVATELSSLSPPYFFEDSERKERAFHYVFVGRHDGPITLDGREFVEGEFKPIREVEEMIAAGELFSAGFVEAFNRFKNAF